MTRAANRIGEIAQEAECASVMTGAKPWWGGNGLMGAREAGKKIPGSCDNCQGFSGWDDRLCRSDCTQYLGQAFRQCLVQGLVRALQAPVSHQFLQLA